MLLKDIGSELAPTAVEIPLFRPCFDEEEEQAVLDVLRSGWLGFGPCVAQFEEGFRRFVGSRASVGTANGTWALRLALRVVGVRGLHVITSPLTFVATAQAILAEGARPVFADVDSRGLLDPESVQDLLEPRCVAVLPVHLGGFAGSIDQLRTICDAAGVSLIEDCAHAVGARYRGRHLGTFGVVGAFSFHAVKPLAMGEGGAIVTDDPALAERATRLRWFGIDRDTYQREGVKNGQRWTYEIEELGDKAYLDNLHAAIGLVQLRKVEHLQARRTALAMRYREGLAEVGDLELPNSAPEEQPSWHLFMIRTDKRESLASHLARRHITTGVHYPLVTRFNALRPYERPTPRASVLSLRLLSLPLYSGMKEDDVDRVIDGVRIFFGESTG